MIHISTHILMCAAYSIHAKLLYNEYISTPDCVWQGSGCDARGERAKCFMMEFISAKVQRAAG